MRKIERTSRSGPDLPKAEFRYASTRTTGFTLKTLQLLELNPLHPSLRLHPLKGRLQGLHSVSINLSHRITLEMLVSEAEIMLINVGSHDAVYR